MDPTDAISGLDKVQSPVGFILTVVFIVAGMSGLLSKAMADYGGVFGAAARAFRRHKAEAIAADEQSNARRLDRLEETIDRLDTEICELQTKDQIHHQYQLYVAGYWEKLQFWAIEKGVTLPPPPMMTYPEWKQNNFPAVEPT